MAFTDKVYERLKWIAMYLLPALGTLYFALSRIWNLPNGEQVVGTITAIDTFLGVLLGISSANYSGDGTLIVNGKGEDAEMYVELINEPDFSNKKNVMFKVKEGGD
jgi:hypothetical protein